MPGMGAMTLAPLGNLVLYEKDVVFAIAREAGIPDQERERGMQPVMIRKGDYYLELRKRMQLARKERADLFISIHADAALNLRGSRCFGLYALAQRRLERGGALVSGAGK